MSPWDVRRTSAGRPIRVRIVLQEGDREYQMGEAEVLEWDPTQRRALLRVDPASVRAPAGTVLPARWWYKRQDGWQADGGRFTCRLQRV